MILQHRHIVRQVVSLLVRHGVPQCEFDDMLSAGTVGLVEAARRYRADSPVPFPAFAAMRVKGAVLDYLRALDPLPRHRRAAVRAGLSDEAITFVDTSILEFHAVSAYHDTGIDHLLAAYDVRLLAARVTADARAQYIVRLIAEGTSQEDVARRLGVTAARISQIMRDVRQQMSKVVHA